MKRTEQQTDYVKNRVCADFTILQPALPANCYIIITFPAAIFANISSPPGKNWVIASFLTKQKPSWFLPSVSMPFTTRFLPANYFLTS